MVNLGPQVPPMIGSVYMEHNVGLNDANCDLLEAIAGCLRSRRPPWIVGGDWNLEPCYLSKRAHRLGGQAVASGAATMGGEELDNFTMA